MTDGRLKAGDQLKGNADLLGTEFLIGMIQPIPNEIRKDGSEYCLLLSYSNVTPLGSNRCPQTYIEEAAPDVWSGFPYASTR